MRTFIKDNRLSTTVCTNQLPNSSFGFIHEGQDTSLQEIDPIKCDVSALSKKLRDIQEQVCTDTR